MKKKIKRVLTFRALFSNSDGWWSCALRNCTWTTKFKFNQQIQKSKSKSKRGVLTFWALFSKWSCALRNCTWATKSKFNSISKSKSPRVPIILQKCCHLGHFSPTKTGGGVAHLETAREPPTRVGHSFRNILPWRISPHEFESFVVNLGFSRDRIKNSLTFLFSKILSFELEKPNRVPKSS